MNKLSPASRFLAALCAGAVFVPAAFMTGCTTTEVGEGYNALSRLDFNRLAVRANLPLYWIADANENETLEPDEFTSLLFYPGGEKWVRDGAFTEAFAEAYAELENIAAEGDPEDARLRAIHAELDHGIPTLVHNDLSGLPDGHRNFVRLMLEAASRIDILHSRMIGAEALESQLPDDAASRSAFRRNWGPRCVAPRTQDDPDCTAIPGGPAPVFDLYPARLQAEDGFCDALEALPVEGGLLTPFSVVREKDGTLGPVPYTEAYKEEMTAIADKLREAANALHDPKESALLSYLVAAAKAFTDNDWEPADEAWSRMNARNSRWYLRIGPDETYWEPCNLKAGFHLTLALINTDSLKWEDRLLPVRQEMENDLAALIGAPYEARQVAFHLPDFIDIVINAGDDRDPLGATIGQSLPNWGPVANEGRGRTVAMSNLYTDPDSVRIQREQVRSLFAGAILDHQTDDPEPGLLATILHEACHNFGPAHEYRFDGRTDTEWFGGPLSTVTEELKAQTGALWFLDWLARHGVISEELQAQTYLDSLRWAMDHASRGMYTGSGYPKAYSQLSAIQLGFLLEEGALRFDPDAAAVNGDDYGSFTVNLQKFPAAVEKLMVHVGRIKATGNRKAAEALRAKYVDSPDALPFELIEERILSHPKANFVYSVEM